MNLVECERTRSYIIQKNIDVLKFRLENLGYQNISESDFQVKTDNVNYYLFYKNYMIFTCSVIFNQLRYRLDMLTCKMERKDPQDIHFDKIVEELLDEYNLPDSDQRTCNELTELLFSTLSVSE